MNYEQGLINDLYPLILPDFRVTFHADRPHWERGRLESCAELMKPGMVVFDIGAEHGDFTSLYRQWVGPEGEVIPVEPSSHYWPFIRDTWNANSFGESPAGSYVGLVGDRNVGRRSIDLGWPKEAKGEGVPDGGFTHLRQNPHHDQLTIDDLSLFIKPHAIVIDIEGAEWHALNGARETLAKAQPLIWVSVHDVGDSEWAGPLFGWYGKSVHNIHNLMNEYGYDYAELPSYGEGERFFLYFPQ